MADLTVYATLQQRDHLGRYLASIPEKARRSIEAAAKKGSHVARARATSKTGAMRATIHPIMFNDFAGGITVGTDHWKFQEEGTAPHPITGEVHFWWENEGRPWMPGSNTISHPGNPAVHFMLAGYEVAKADLMREVEANF